MTISFSNEELHKLLRTVADGNTDRHEGVPDDVERAEARATLQLNACSIISHLLADYEHLRNEVHFW